MTTSPLVKVKVEVEVEVNEDGIIITASKGGEIRKWNYS
jgi:hypothetical protein